MKKTIKIFFTDETLHLKFKIKCTEDQIGMSDKIKELITEYVNRKRIKK